MEFWYVVQGEDERILEPKAQARQGRSAENIACLFGGWQSVLSKGLCLIGGMYAIASIQCI